MKPKKRRHQVHLVEFDLNQTVLGRNGTATNMSTYRVPGMSAMSMSKYAAICCNHEIRFHTTLDVASMAMVSSSGPMAGRWGSQEIFIS